MYTLLLVDDERDILINLSTYFPWEKGGFIVVGQAETGLEALRFIQQQPVDLILCDIRMPGFSGLEFAKKIKELGLPSRIIFLSAYRRFEYAKEAFRYGVRDYLLKPPDFQELLNSLYRVRNELDAEREAQSSNDELSTSSPDPTIQAIRAYLQGNLEHACLQRVATLVGMNPNYLSSFFKEKMGIPFSEYLMKLRMGKAKQLLSDPQYSVQRVSKLVGYSNVKNFTRAFKYYFGFPPSSLRRGIQIHPLQGS
ncbi:MAG: response regulator [Spirochaetes bacterium]|nr:response regulator [Spirochaetota bacterium]